MQAAFVHIQVKPQYVDDFIEITRYNHNNSIMEDGCARFDFLQSTEDPSLFYLYEVYTTPEAAAAHKQTEHYNKWRETVEPFMAQPRSADKAISLLPEPWE